MARHAETNYNVLGFCNDSPEIDVHLTTKGIQQAKLLATSLASADFELIITSEFPRTKETADIINKSHNVPKIVDALINDVLTGFEGRPAKEFRKARVSADNVWTARFNGGESFEDEKERVRQFLNSLRARTEKSILIVTHQAIGRLIYANINSLPNEQVDDLDVNNTHCFEFEI